MNHLVVQSVQVIQTVGDTGQVGMTRVLVIRQSWQVAIGWIDIRRHHHATTGGV